MIPIRLWKPSIKRSMNRLLAILSLCLVVAICPVAYAETVNINTDNAAKMARLIKGVGPKKAQAIVQYRSKKGPFKRPWHIMRVKGIGRKTYEKNKHIIVIQSK